MMIPIICLIVLGANSNPPANVESPRKAIEAGISWLTKHQSPEGYWDVNEYWINNTAGGTACPQGAGAHVSDVGITALALMALVHDERTVKKGTHATSILRATKWLISAQDEKSGLLCEQLGVTFLYDHAIATAALAETLTLCKGKKHFEELPVDDLKETLQAALLVIQKSRNPKGVWRYQVSPIGENDTSITGWMLAAVEALKPHVTVKTQTIEESVAKWIEKVTDPETARTGYDTIGSMSARVTGVNDDFSTDKGEAMTAVALRCRLYCGQTDNQNPIIKRQAELLLTQPPLWEPEAKTVDMYYWYHSTLALSQLNGKTWRKWKKPMQAAALAGQCDEKNDYKGSWDPVGTWGWSGGRIYSTALMVLILEEIDS